MKKEGLKTGMLVELRRGDICMVLDTTLVSKNDYHSICTWNSLNFYEDNREFWADIVKVSKVLDGYLLKPKNWSLETLNANLLWEREEVPEYVEIVKNCDYFKVGDIHKVINYFDKNTEYSLRTLGGNDFWYKQAKSVKPSTKEAYEAQFKSTEMTIEELEELTGLKNLKIKKKMKNLGKLTAWGLLLVAVFFIHILSSHIVLSIAGLYSIELITSMSFLQVFGLLMIIDIVKYRYRPEKDESAEFIDKLMRAINSILTTTMAYLMMWAIAFLSFAILN
jgi:hypothetical protein